MISDLTKQNEALQAALVWSQQQTHNANAVQLQMAADIDALKRKIAALEAEKPAEK